jgi:hypothetical protein
MQVKEYEKPLLIEYESLKDITAGGSPPSALG